MDFVIETVKAPGAIFATANTGAFVTLHEHKAVTFLIESGEGTAANTTITVEAKAGEDAAAQAIPFLYRVSDGDGGEMTESAAFSIGGAAGKSKFALVTVTGGMLGGKDYDRVAVKTTAVTSSTVPGSIVAVKTEPRY